MAKTADKAAEAAFFDKEYTEGSRKAVGKIYSIIRNRRLSYEATIYDDVAGKRVLEYGCGTGSHSMEMARMGAEVVGIDISEQGIRVATERAAEANLPNATYEVMDAEEMTFPDCSFDLIIGEGILHHLDLEKCYAEISRVLKPGGKAVFMEPLGHNPAIVLFRRVTPSMRTEDEHPLMKRDLDLARKYFGRVRYEYHHLTSFASLPFVRTPLFHPLVNFFDKVDRGLFKLPGVGLLSWYAIMELGRSAETVSPDA
jgi:ubiquinone/menaquinone biosynthesis C-methylase UbiE